MSQILDAINKAEDERKRRADNEQSKTVDKSQVYKRITQQYSDEDKPKSRLSSLLLVLLGIGTALYYQQRQYGDDTLPSADKVTVSATVIDAKNTPNVTNDVADKLIQNDAPVVDVPLETAKKKSKETTLDSIKIENNVDQPPSTNMVVNNDNLVENVEPKVSDNTAQVIEEKTGRKPTATPSLAPLTNVVKKTNDDKKLFELKPIAASNNAKKTNLVELQKPIIATRTKPKSQASKNTAKPHRSTKKTQNSQSGFRQTPRQTVAKSRQQDNSKRRSSRQRGWAITAIVYDDNPSARMALINGKIVREGTIIPNTKTKVVRILSTGIIVNDGGGDVLIGTR